jgi:hypothetical protein
VIVLDTIKGRGVSFWEGNPVNHNITISKEQLADALGELDIQLAAIG